MSQPYQLVERCRICGAASFDRFLFFGETPLANALISPERAHLPEQRFPLRVMRCTDCALVQLDIVVSPEILFRQYPYASSASAPLLAHFDELARDLAARFTGRDRLVIEIGSNDGTLLTALAAQGLRVLGVEPANNLAGIANARGLETWNDFFGVSLARQLAEARGLAAAIIGTNVFAHIHDLRDVLAGVDALLAADGVFVGEVPYLPDLLERVEYDTIYHEHLSYFAVAPLARLFASSGMELVDVRRLAVHGGSIRFVAARAGARPVAAAVAELRHAEMRSGLATGAPYARFATAVRASRQALRELLVRIRADGKRVAALGATAKGNTLLNYCGLGINDVEYIADSTSLKQGLLAPGSHIPIRPEAAIREDRPDYVLLLAWNYADPIIARYRDYLTGGGRFIHPIPSARVIEA